MNKFRFSLDSMLHYKDALLDKEKNTLMQLRAQQREIEDRIRRNEAQALAMDQELKHKARVGVTVVELKTLEFQMENGRRLVKELNVEYARMTALAERQREIVMKLSQEVSGLDKLRDKQLEEYRYIEQKEEQVRIGELVSSKYAAQGAR